MVVGRYAGQLSITVMIKTVLSKIWISKEEVIGFYLMARLKDCYLGGSVPSSLQCLSFVLFFVLCIFYWLFICVLYCIFLLTVTWAVLSHPSLQCTSTEVLALSTLSATRRAPAKICWKNNKQIKLLLHKENKDFRTKHSVWNNSTPWCDPASVWPQCWTAIYCRLSLETQPPEAFSDCK